MNDTQLNINHLFEDSKFNQFYNLGLIDDIALRNLSIKLEYRKLRKTKSMPAAIEHLSQKYFLSFDSINSILFRQRNKKEVFNPLTK